MFKVEIREPVCKKWHKISNFKNYSGADAFCSHVCKGIELRIIKGRVVLRSFYVVE
jgi:hypothetical protein